MRLKLSVQTTGALLLLLAAISWGVVVMEASLAHTVSLMSVGSAVLVTGLVFAWPFLNGARVQGGAIIHQPSCHLCGTLPVPGLRFCIRCGAYPKARAASAS